MDELTPVASGATMKPRAGDMEVLAVILLLVGGAAFLVGWLVGFALLWASPRWRWTDKLVGTFIWPGGLAGLAVVSLLVAFPPPPPGCDPPIACLAFVHAPPLWAAATGFVALAIAQIAVATWLLRRARNSNALPASQT